ncbi:Similar to Alpha-glucosidase; acc. no. Q9P6J3 [Pyronema omphalodes CBS 100304]|uniref:Similar to Alpha-glucosidase acc. no. Q9P6J3 n=1 Tax=Pyronema omphalodes (strain CBS 100304) TaxID=1076935 RepID=U4L2D1_PYROM|nr:Similar to Alpha-glucosidase; acc. no. Q9P6J3 [Pyronema omphalodes CBS 100304]
MTADPVPLRSTHRWWKEAVVYQIYPTSFQDSNGDGIGDIPGIISRLDYLKSLGVDVLWLSPVYKSPLKDMGYDISDYLAIDPRYGTMEDIEKLISGCHQRGMKLLMDLVVNHTSEEHAWFMESRKDKINDKRDWYIWRNPKIGPNGERIPPNNWRAVFGGSAWDLDETTQQYYLHCFLPSQPDLNHENHLVRSAVHRVMDFWLKKGVDGFRQDVINLISKAPGLPDAPITFPDQFLQPAYPLFSNGPRLHEFLKEMRTAVLSRYDTMTVGEMPWCTDKEEVLRCVGEDRGELDMIFQFDIIEMDFGPAGRFTDASEPWTLKTLRDIIEGWQSFMIQNSGWNSIAIESHDQPRSVTRFFPEDLYPGNEDRERRAKMMATLCAAQSGTLFMFQGQEIGMQNIPTSWDIDDYKDIETKNAYQLAKEKGHLEQFWNAARLKARDNGRTPVQWDGTENAGFTKGSPWMRVNDDYKEWNVEEQVKKEGSVWSFWKNVLEVRKKYRGVLVYGGFEMLDKKSEDVLAWRREGEGKQALVVMNWKEGPVTWKVPEKAQGVVKEENVRLKNYGEVKIGEGEIMLSKWEAVLFVDE